MLTIIFYHRVVVLEGLERDAKWLIYLKPRKEDQWFKFFNETVTYARETQVFQDNFGGNDGTIPHDPPLRTPYFLIYLKASMLDSLLG